MFAKTFRNTLLASSLLIGASLLAGPAALAVEGAGGVSGAVESVTAVSFSGTLGTAITPGADVASYPMGSLTLQNNTAGTWTLQVKSTNAGSLVNGPNSIPYTALTVAAIDGVTLNPVTPTGVYQPIVTAAAFNNTVAAGVTRAVTASISAAASSVPTGTYTDTITFELTAN